MAGRPITVTTSPAPPARSAGTLRGNNARLLLFNIFFLLLFINSQDLDALDVVKTKEGPRGAARDTPHRDRPPTTVRRCRHPIRTCRESKSNSSPCTHSRPRP